MSKKEKFQSDEHTKVAPHKLAVKRGPLGMHQNEDAIRANTTEHTKTPASKLAPSKDVYKALNQNPDTISQHGSASVADAGQDALDALHGGLIDKTPPA